MSADDYKRFKHDYLSSFRKTYSHARQPQKRLLKKEILDNPNLTTKQKEDFWNLVLLKNI